MSKARDLADFISTGSILSDGTIESTEISGVTATANELNVLDGITVTTEELNVLDGITVTTEELNNVAGINSSVQTQLDSKASATDLTNAINGLGTASALDVGTGADNIPQLDAEGKLPAVDGSQLTNIEGLSAASLMKYGAI